MTPDQEKRLKLLERADLRRRGEVEKGERRTTRKANRKARWRKRWAWWVAFWEETAKHLKTAGLVAAGAAGVVSGSVTLYKNATGAWHSWHHVKRAWSFYADRDVGEPDQPPPTGAPSTALDFAKTRGRPPDGGER